MSKYTVQQYEMYEKFKTQAKCGDILLTQTNNIMYVAARKVLKVTFDHVSVLLSDDKLIHISWPNIRLIHPLQILTESSECRIIRPNLNEQERNTFLCQLETSLDQSYDVLQFMRGVWRKLFSEWSSDQEFWEKSGLDIWLNNGELSLQKKKVCTDLVYFALGASSLQFRQLLKEKIHALDFRIIGSFTPDDFSYLSKVSDFFIQIQLDVSGNTIDTKGRFKEFKKNTKQLLFGNLSYIQDLQLFNYVMNFSRSINMPNIPNLTKVTNIFNMLDSLMNVFNLVAIITLPQKQMIKSIITLIVKRVGGQQLNKLQQRKLINQSFNIVEILRLTQQKRTLKNSMQLVRHLVDLLIDKQIENGNNNNNSNNIKNKHVLIMRVAKMLMNKAKL